MVKLPEPMIDPNTIDWGSRPDVQNILACLETGKPGKFNIKNASANLIRLAGSSDVWPREAFRASAICAENFETIKPELFKSLKSGDPLVACGAFTALLAYHVPHNSNTTMLSSKEVGEVYSEALRWSLQLDYRRIQSGLSTICHCWINVVEFQSAELKQDLNTIKISELTSLGQTQDAFVARQVLGGEGTLILGMSVGSSRFNASRTDDILEWLECIRADAQLMITDRPARHNRYALGDSEEEALRYCLKKGRQLRGYTAETLNSPHSQMQLFNWDEIYASAEFTNSMKYLEGLIESSSEFKNDVAAQTKKVLEREAKGQLLSDNQIRTGMTYLLEEFAAIMAVAEISQAPVAYAYYTEWKPFQKLVNGDYDQVVRNLGFIQYDLPEDKPSALN